MNHIDPRIFPTVLMALDFVAAIVWAFHGNVRQAVYGSIADAEVYLKEKADEAIAELKARIQLDDDEMEGFLQLEEECGGGDLRKYIAELKQKLEDAKATAYAESVDAGMENRKLKRALWLARADRAKTEYNHWILIWHCEINNHLFFINKTRYKNRAKVDRLHYPWEWRDIWDEVERKCRAKAEEYR